MADKESRTQPPTPKRRREARRSGQVARSPDLAPWLALLAVLVAAPSLFARAESEITGLTGQVMQAAGNPDPQKAVALLGTAESTLLSIVLPVVAVAGGLGLAAALGQVGFHLSPGAVGFKLSRLSPRGGLTRIFSSRGLWQLTKDFLRIAVLSSLAYAAARHLLDALLAQGTLPLSATISSASAGIMALVREIAVAGLLFGVADYAFQRRRLNDSLKMTKDEVKRELKDAEGNPEIRRAIRRRARQLTRMQMIAAAASADVVVVNPTHYAVALAYERGRHRAPHVVAKGEDDLAAAIRAVALDHRVPIVESPLLARNLHASCEIGTEIPPDLYQVVAKLLAFVYRLTPAARALVDVHHVPPHVLDASRTLSAVP